MGKMGRVVFELLQKQLCQLQDGVEKGCLRSCTTNFDSPLSSRPPTHRTHTSLGVVFELLQKQLCQLQDGVEKGCLRSYIYLHMFSFQHMYIYIYTYIHIFVAVCLVVHIFRPVPNKQAAHWLSAWCRFGRDTVPEHKNRPRLDGTSLGMDPSGRPTSRYRGSTSTRKNKTQQKNPPKNSDPWKSKKC